MKYTPRLPTTNVNVSKGSLLWDMTLLLGGLAGLVLVVYLALGWSVDMVAPRMSYETELKIMRMLGDHPFLVGTRPAPDKVTSLAQTVRTRVTDIPYPVRVLVRPSSFLGAWALPGGTLVITSGLLSTVQSRNELAFVLGHELGHIEHRDHLRAMGRGLVLMALSTLIPSADTGPGGMVAGMLRLTERTYSRAQETRADEAGQDALYSLYGHVDGAETVLARLASPGVSSWTMRLESTHPDMAARIRHLRQRAAAKGWPAHGPLMPLDAGLTASRPGAPPS